MSDTHLLEGRLRDALNRLVNLAVARPGEPLPQLLFGSFEFLFFEQLAQVACAFELDGEEICTVWPGGDPPAPPVFEDAHRITAHATAPTARCVAIRPDLDRRERGAEQDGLRWLRVSVEGELAEAEADLFAHLCRWTEWQKQLVALVEALWLRRRPDGRQAVVAFDRLGAELQALVGGAYSLRHKLDWIIQALGARRPDLNRESRARFAREAAEWAVQALHAGGWAQRPLDADAVFQQCAELADHLLALAGAPRVDPGTQFKLRCLAVSLGVVPERLPEPPPETEGPLALSWLLAAWTRKHGRARRRAESFGVGPLDLDRIWPMLVARSQAALADHLGRATAAGALSPDWLRGWLLLELLGPLSAEVRSNTADHSGTWALLADFAFVAREEIRRLLFGARPDFRVQPDALRASLAHLVAFHARRCLGLPAGLDLRQLLTRLAEPRGGADGDPFAAGHLDHALYVYLGGQVALGLSFERSAAAEISLAELLVHDRSLTVEGLRQAFALAALCHDAGVQLAPRSLPPVPGLVGPTDQARLQAGPAGREAGGLVRDCLEDLRQAGAFHPPEGVQPADFEQADQPLLDWLVCRPAADQYTHEVLGAWCLARRALGISTSEQLSLRPVLRAALRAILLHRAFTVPLNPKVEPCAWLLVLCDELLDWDPPVLDRRLGAPRGRSPRVLGGDLQPHRSRARAARLEGVRAALEAERLRLRVPGGEGDRLRIQVRLRADIGLAGRSQLVWLAAAQNLERLEPLQVGAGEGAVRVGPTVSFEMALAGWRRDAEFDTRKLLREALARFDHPARGAIHRWLQAAEGRIGLDPVEGLEWVRFEARGEVLWHEDLRRAFGPLVRLCDTLISERALLQSRRRQEAG